MAKNTSKQTATTEASSTTEEFDYAQYLPEEFKDLAGELHQTGGLIPVYYAKMALESHLEPVVGWIDRLVKLKDIDQGGGKIFSPIMLQVVLERPCKAFVKRGDDDYETVDLKPGEEVFIPMSANLAYNKDVVAAATNKTHTTFCIFRVTGERKVNNQPSKMIEIAAVMAGKPPKAKVREGRFAIPLDTYLIRSTDANGRGENLAQLPSGEVFDKDGVVRSAVTVSASPS